MATNTYVEIPLPEAATVADLAGVIDDLELAQKLSIRLENIYLQESNLSDLVDPLTTALAIKYCRPYTGGRRLNWPMKSVLSSLNDEEKELHKLLLILRDKHFAHSVNYFEANQPIARYWVETVQEEGIQSIQCNRHRTIGLSIVDLQAVRALCEKQLGVIRRHFDDERGKLLLLVRALPIGAVLAWGSEGPPLDPDPSKARRPF